MQHRLEESLDQIYTIYYQDSPKGHLDRDEFDDVIAIDPTFNREKDVLGTYGKWLLKLRLENKRDFTDHEIQELEDQLTIFDEHKRTYQVEDRDINRLHSIEDLININNKYDSGQSTPELIKATQFPGLEVIGQTGDWEVYRPTTWEASKYIRGDNAVWCTGRAKDRSWFDRYNVDKILIVFINKSNRDDKYQGAFTKDTFECTEFRDAQNNAKKFIEFLLENPDVETALKNSDYSQIITILEAQKKAEEEAYRQKIKILNKVKQNTRDFLDQYVIDGWFQLTRESATQIFNYTTEEGQRVIPDRTIPNDLEYRKELDLDKVLSINSLVPAFQRIRGINLTENNLEWVDKLFWIVLNEHSAQRLSLKLPVAEVVDIAGIYMREVSCFKELFISKESKFNCFKQDLKMLAPKIKWY